MLNIMKADLQRIFRGKGIYITLAFYLLILAMSLYGETEIVSIGMENVDMSQLLGEIEDFRLTGANIAFKIMRNTDNLFYIMLPIIVFIASSDFSSGAIKNVLSNGMSRTEYYLSKLILSGIFAAILYSFYIIAAMIIITIREGFGGTFDLTFIISVLKPFLAQLLLILAVTCVGNLFVFLTKKTSAFIGLYLAFLMLTTLIIQTIVLITGRFESLYAYDLVMNTRTIINIGTFSSGEIIKYLLVGIGYILVSTMGGMLLFNRSEIK